MSQPKTTTRWPSSDDLTFGPGATRVEKTIAYLTGLGLVLFVLWQYFTHAVNWPVWQLVLALVIAVDLGAGAVANILDSCARYYAAGPLPTDPWLVRQIKNPYIFTAIHIYPLLVWGIYGPGGWVYGLVGYALVVAASIAVMRVPVRYQRPLAYLITVLVIAYGAVLLPAPAGFAWLMPVLFLKLVAGHAVKPHPMPGADESWIVIEGKNSAARNGSKAYSQPSAADQGGYQRGGKGKRR